MKSNSKGYGGKTHYSGSQNSNTTAPSSRELYHLQFLLLAANPETFGYTLVSRAYRDTYSLCCDKKEAVFIQAWVVAGVAGESRKLHNLYSSSNIFT
jgi:hypothetical protein